jgi:hypothetical protein
MHSAPGSGSQAARGSLLNTWQRLCIGVGFAVAAMLLLFPVWKDSPDGAWYRYLLARELGRSFVLDPPKPPAVIHLTRMLWDLAMVAVGTAGLMWIAAPRPTDGQSVLANLRGRRARLALVAAVCFPLPVIPAPLWVLVVLLLAEGGVGTHHAGLPAPVAVPVLVIASTAYAGVLYGLMTAALRIAAYWARG